MAKQSAQNSMNKVLIFFVCLVFVLLLSPIHSSRLLCLCVGINLCFAKPRMFWPPSRHWQWISTSYNPTLKKLSLKEHQNYCSKAFSDDLTSFIYPVVFLSSPCLSFLPAFSPCVLHRLSPSPPPSLHWSFLFFNRWVIDLSRAN